MSCEGAALPFQSHANYGTWSIDFALNYHNIYTKFFVTLCYCLKEKERAKTIAILIICRVRTIWGASKKFELFFSKKKY